MDGSKEVADVVAQGDDGTYHWALIVAGTQAGQVKVHAEVTDVPACFAEALLDVVCGCDGNCTPGAESVQLAGNHALCWASDCGDAEPSCDDQGGGVHVSWSMGNLSDGRSAGKLYINSSVNSPRLGKPKGLRYHLKHVPASNPNNAEAQGLWQGGVLRQVKTPQGLADIVDSNPNDNTYQIDFYSDPANGWQVSGGFYTIPSNHEPYLTWVITWLSDTQFRLQKYDPSGQSPVLLAQYTYTYSPPQGQSSDWSWSVAVSDGTNTVRTETENWHPYTDNGSSYKRRTYEVQQDGGTYYKAVETYKLSSSRKDLVEVVVDPDGVALTTTCSYYTDGKLKSQQNPDGSWAWYNYDTPQSGTRAITVITGLGDQAFTSNPNPDGSTVRSTTLAFDDTHHRIVSAVEKVGGVLVSQTDYSYTGGTSQEPNLTQSLQLCTDTDCEAYLTAAITYEGTDWDKVLSVAYPDTSYDDYAREYGTWHPENNGGFEGSTGEAATRTTVTHYGPEGTRVADKSTRDVWITDEAGHPVKAETQVYGSGGYNDGNPAAWTRRLLDARGRVTDVFSSQGTHAQTTWSTCCTVESTTDATGVLNNYDFDTLRGRPVSQVRPGFTPDPQQTAAYSYSLTSGLHQQTATLTYTSGDTLTTVQKSDGAGRPYTVLDENGVTTRYEYDLTSQGGRKITVTRPYDASDPDTGIKQTLAYYRDGRIKSVSGDGVVKQAYKYSASAGQQSVKVLLGTDNPDDTACARWTKTTVDMLGRTVSVERPAFTTSGSATVTTTYEYVADGEWGAGQLKKITPPDTAPILYDYDSLGELYRVGLDYDHDGALAPDSADRIQEIHAFFESTDDQWWAVTESKAYPYSGGGSATAKVLGRQKQRLTGYSYSDDSEVIVQETKLEDGRTPTANVTTARVKLDRAARQLTTEADYPDITGTDFLPLSQTVNGRLQWRKSRSGATASFTYDGFGRAKTSSGPRSGVETELFYATNKNQISAVTTSGDAGTATLSYAYYPASHRHAGLLKAVTSPDISNSPSPSDKKTYYEYNDRGQLVHLWGHVPQPMWIEYDNTFGQVYKLHTYRDGTLNWTGTSWPSGAGDGDLTVWEYDDATGLLKDKLHADGLGTNYLYTSAGRLQKRIWARDSYGLYAEYDYDNNTGELTNIDYSDNTPDVSFEYTRLGLPYTITEGTGSNQWTRTFTYNDDLELWKENIAGPAAGYSKLITREYHANAPGRLSTLKVGTTSNPTADYQATYGFDEATGRPQTVTGPGLPASGANYGYATGSDLLQTLEFKSSGSNVIASVTRSYESVSNRLDSIENKWFGTSGGSGTTVSKYDYANNVLGLRTGLTQTGTAFSATTSLAYGYNDRRELASAERTGSLEHDWAYEYDPIGNRTNSAVDGTDETTAYGSNELNQHEYTDYTNPNSRAIQHLAYDADGNPQIAYVAGDMNCDSTMDFFDIDPFIEAVLDPEQYASDYPGCPWLNADMNGDGEVDTFDLDAFADLLTGNNGAVALAYTWDAENRLLSIGSPAGATLLDGQTRSSYAYDAAGRRIERKVETWDAGTSTWGLTTHRKYVYDGWNLLLELDGLNSNAIVRKYTWGLDLSQSRQGAGGIGGLLGTQEGSNSYLYFYDGGGNVGQVVNAANGTLAAQYEYDPYGSRLGDAAQGEYDQPFRFSTKAFDQETGLGYWGKRYYSPKLGRWLNRDPLGEQGGMNIYDYVHNNPVMRIDPWGLDDDNECGLLETFVRMFTWEGVNEITTGSASSPGMAYMDACLMQVAQVVAPTVGPVIEKAEDVAQKTYIQSCNVLGVAGGALEIGLGFAIIYGTGGMGAAVGVLPLMHGFDTAQASLRGLCSCEVAPPTETQSMIKTLTGSDTLAVLGDIGLGVLFGHGCERINAGSWTREGWIVRQESTRYIEEIIGKGRKIKGNPKATIFLDTKSGKFFKDVSRGNNPANFQDCWDPTLLRRMSDPSNCSWSPLNCGEPNAFNRALLAGCREEDLVGFTRDIKTGRQWAMCGNCVESMGNVRIASEPPRYCFWLPAQLLNAAHLLGPSFIDVQQPNGMQIIQPVVPEPRIIMTNQCTKCH